jgi:hypothetical protein
LFGTAAGSPGYSSGIGIYLAGQPSCVNNCSEEEALLPGSGWIGSRIHLAARPAYEQLFGNLHLLPGVPAASEQLFGQPGRLSGSWAKKKEQENQDLLFFIINQTYNKGYVIILLTSR